MFFERAKSGFGSAWTPAAIAAAAVVIITALGGQAGLSTLIGASEETRREIRESEARIMAKFEEKDRADRAAHDAINARISLEAARCGQGTELLCQLNDGPPNETWPCGEQRFDPPKKGNLAPKWTTARKYP